MTKANAWVWKTGRVVLAVVLLALVFKYTIKISDAVRLADGTEVTGTITRPFATDRHGSVIQSPDNKLQMTVAGKTCSYALADVARRKGEPMAEYGLVSLLRQMTLGAYLVGLIVLGFVPLVATVRWRWLLDAQSIHVSFWTAFKLTLIGLFFNNFMPGLTGGDVVKAYYVAKLTNEKKTHAVVTVFLDRVIGMVALGIVAAAAILIGVVGTKAASGAEYREAIWFVVFFVVFSVAGGLVFYSRRLRRFFGGAVRLLPGYGRLRSTKLAGASWALLKRVDEALFLYRYKKSVLANTTAISLVAHSSAIIGIYCFGRALRITDVGIVHYFVVVPVCFIISSVPLTPAGWGVGEVVFRTLFGAVGVAGTAAVTMSIIYRLTQALWTLPGGVFLMVQRDRPAIADVEAEMPADFAEEDGPNERS